MVTPLPAVLSTTVDSLGCALCVIHVGVNPWAAAAALLNQSSGASRRIPQHCFWSSQVLLSLLKNIEC